MARAKFVPHPGKQTEFLASTVDRIFYGGARGGGKSLSLAWKAAFQPRKYYYVYENRRITRDEFFALQAAGKDPKFIVEKMSIHYPDYLGILIRRTHPQLQRNLKPETDKLYKEYDGIWKERHNCYVFPSGAKIYLVHCIDRRALDDYIGGNYNFIGIDEANLFPEDWVEMLETSLRTDNSELKPLFCLTSNPGNIGHCVPFGEVLTPGGWKDIKDVSIGDTVATSSEKDEIYFTKVSQKTEEDFDGMLKEYDAIGNYIIATPNHKIVRHTETKNAKGRKINGPRLTEIKNLPKVSRLVRTGTWKGVEIEKFILPEYKASRKLKNKQPDYLNGDIYAELMGWFLSEGCTGKRDKAFYICQSKTDNRLIIEKLLNKARFKYSKSDTGFIIYSGKWWSYLKQFGKCRDKFIPDNLKNSTQRQLQIFLDAAMLGDGHKTSYYTNSKRLADDMQEIGLKLGHAPSLRSSQRKNRKGLSYVINFRIREDGWIESERFKDVPFLGKVYCLGIDKTHRFWIRQNGHVWLSGNSWLKKTYVDRCKPILDGPIIHNKEFDIDYQPYRTAPPYIDSEGISHTFIPATVFDNPSIIDNDKSYVRKLKQLTPVLRQMWLEGRWDVFAGMFFDMWDPAIHIIFGSEYERYKKFGTDNFNKNTHTLFRFYDYGTKANFVCLFAAIGQDKRMIIFDEIVEKGLAASAQAQMVNEYTEQVWGLTQTDFADEICDPSFNFLTSEKDGDRYSPLMYYEDEGIMLTTAARDRKIAAKVLYNALSGKNPDIRFTENCEYMIETLPNLPQKETDLEDVEDRGTDDHGYDALKYGATEILQGGGFEEEKEGGWREDLVEEAKAVDSNTGWMGV